MKLDLSTKNRDNHRASHGVVAVREVTDAASNYKIPASSTECIAIKHILACVDGTDKDESVLDQALQVARRFSSHIDVLHVQFDVHGVTDEKRHEGLFDRLLADPVERATIDAAVRARSHFRDWSARCTLPLRDCGIALREPSMKWREVIGYEADVIAGLGRVSDLIVIGRPGQIPSSSSMSLEIALFDTGRPVLMVPVGGPANLFHRPLIAWNGSREAARAVGFALPFLSEFSGCVDIFAAPEGKHQTDTNELVRYLSCHGIVAERIAAGEATGMSLLAQASTSRSGLIVMGAYTHGHYRQFLFGGMTRYVMEHAAIPVLFAH
jgi:nucleotide-binding universal stress UspA family protein